MYGGGAHAISEFAALTVRAQQRQQHVENLCERQQITLLIARDVVKVTNLIRDFDASLVRVHFDKRKWAVKND